MNYTKKRAWNILQPHIPEDVYGVPCRNDIAEKSDIPSRYILNVQNLFCRSGALKKHQTF